MKMNLRSLLAIFTSIAMTNTASATVRMISDSMDDTDLTGYQEPSLFSWIAPSLQLRPDEIRRTEIPTGLELVIQVRNKRGSFLPVTGLTVYSGNTELQTDAAGSARLSECAPRSQFRFQAELTDSHFSVSDGSTPYRLQMSVDCGMRVELTFNEESEGGQPLSIWNVTSAAKAKLSQTVGLGFWNRAVEMIWPEQGDYYSGGRVHISRGDHWDVVGHELGHAIYDLGRIGGFGGGSHKIDECYTESLALSEGWASYFSAWVQIALDDADARFEYLVPRRAPIRFETIPDDVCSGPTNEWRVTGFLWDLIDSHADGETLEAQFAQLWFALQGSRTPGAKSAAKLFEKAGLSAEVLNPIWELNFKTPRSNR